MSSEASISSSLLYDVLGVSSQANQQAIKTAYRKKSLMLHPDKNPSTDIIAKEKSKECFAALNEAYNILINPTQRADYDRNSGSITTNANYAWWKKLAQLHKQQAS